MALEYLREYRTYYHIGTSRGIDETTAMRIIKKVEDILIKSGLFNLPGKETRFFRTYHVKSTSKMPI
jgi:5-carboxymethyl-2-hydroxymuconate isomerase